jgi:hypothetical protein
MLKIISHLDEYTPTDLKQLEIMVALATKKGYLVPREQGWCRQAIQKGEAIGVKRNELLIGHAMLSTVTLQNGQRHGVMHGIVWREKYNGDELIFTETLRIAKDRFNTTYAIVNNSNLKSLNLCKAHGAHLIKHVQMIESSILEKLLYDEGGSLLAFQYDKI